MGSHDDAHDELLNAFLAGELDRSDARRWDEHLLECERCWRAVREDGDARRALQVLRRPAPPWLADRVRFAVEVAAASSSQRKSGARIRKRRLAVSAVGAVIAIITGLVLTGLLASGRPGKPVVAPAAVVAVARYAQVLPAGSPSHVIRSGRRTQPHRVGRRMVVMAGGQRIVLTTWRVDGVEMAVATSARFFPMPPGARGVPGRGMAWSARLGKLTLYCVNGSPSQLLAAPVPEPVLVLLAARLPHA